MKIPYFCCIGAELKRYEKDFDFMNQVYLYKIPTDDTIEEVLAQDYFKDVADTVLQDDILYIYEPTTQVLYTCRFNKQNGHITAIQMANNIPELTPNRVLISDATGHITAGDVTLEYLKNKVNLDGTSIMTGPLKMRSSISFKCAIAPSWDGVGFYKLNDNDSVTLMASMETTDGLCPAANNTYNIGKASHKWKDLYLGGKAYVATLNNGADLTVPNKSGTLATMGDVELAAQSGRMLTDQGVWYAKMYAGTTPPAAEDDTNYADFSQVDQDNNPIIVIYTRTSGAWVQSEIITPPAEYDGYVPITSKIWDIAEQTGQQGGRVLWNHVSKEFTPYPTIISFEDAALTGTSTAPTPTNSSPNNQIATKEYVDTQVPAFLATKADTDLSNVSAGIDFVIDSQLPTAYNNYTWYRKYRSGWVEQGGKTTSSNDASVILPITMSDANYTVVVAKEGSETTAVGVAPHNITTIGFEIKICYNNSLVRVMDWHVSGMAAS